VTDLVELHHQREIAGLYARLPGSLLLGVLGFTVLGMFVLGVNNSYDGRRSAIALISLVLVFGSAFYLILDNESRGTDSGQRSAADQPAGATRVLSLPGKGGWKTCPSRQHNHPAPTGPAGEGRHGMGGMVVIGALAVCMDFINLFLLMLRRAGADDLNRRASQRAVRLRRNVSLPDRFFRHPIRDQTRLQRVDLETWVKHFHDDGGGGRATELGAHGEHIGYQTAFPGEVFVHARGRYIRPEKRNHGPVRIDAGQRRGCQILPGEGPADDDRVAQRDLL
jgi:hypothetical protein